MVCQGKGRILVNHILSIAGLGGFLHIAWAVPAWEKPDLVLKACRGEIEEAHVSWWGFDAHDSTEFLQSVRKTGGMRGDPSAEALSYKQVSRSASEPLPLPRYS